MGEAGHGQRRWSNIHLNIRVVFSNNFDAVTAYYEPLLRSAKVKTITHFELPRMAKNPQSEMEQYIAYLVSKIGCNHDFVHIYIFPTTVERPDEMAEHQLYLNV